jgi:hypothetical protein
VYAPADPRAAQPQAANDLNRLLIDDATAPGTWAYVDVDAAAGVPNAAGTDAIKVAMLYRPGRVTPVPDTTGAYRRARSRRPWTCTSTPTSLRAGRQHELRERRADQLAVRTGPVPDERPRSGGDRDHAAPLTGVERPGVGTSRVMSDQTYEPGDVGDDDSFDPDDITDLDQAFGDDSVDETVYDKGYSPPERPLALNRFGTTPAEEAEGESLDQRLAEEEPDPTLRSVLDGSDDDVDAVDETRYDEEDLRYSEVGEERAGRLVAPDEGLAEDREKALVGEDVGIDNAGASAEEAAVHIIPE